MSRPPIQESTRILMMLYVRSAANRGGASFLRFGLERLRQAERISPRAETADRVGSWILFVLLRTFFLKALKPS